jgi:hypothetical protein
VWARENREPEGWEAMPTTTAKKKGKKKAASARAA